MFKTLAVLATGSLLVFGSITPAAAYDDGDFIRCGRLIKAAQADDEDLLKSYVHSINQKFMDLDKKAVAYGKKSFLQKIIGNEASVKTLFDTVYDVCTDSPRKTLNEASEIVYNGMSAYFSKP